MIGSRRFLTRPSTPGYPSWDNRENDLIVATNDIIGDNTNSYRIISLLGRGAYGQVVSCIDLKTGEFVAIKIAKSPHPYFECAKNESQILKILNNASMGLFVQYKLDFIFKQHFCIVLEKLDRNLYELAKMRKFSGIAHGEVKIIARQLVEAMIVMHRNGIVHCDIKPENILIAEPGKFNVRIVDFGSAFFRFKNNNNYVQSRYYRAPEVIMNESYNSAVDVWSFGCVVYEIFTGRPLFPGRENNDQLARILFFFKNEVDDDVMLQNIDKEAYLTSGMAFDLIKRTSEDKDNNLLLIDFINFCLKYKPIDRPISSEIINHPYLSGNVSVSSSNDEQFGDSVVSRDQQHPPPNKFNRRYTTASSSKFNLERNRKQSNF